jgi:hypothetical protein
MTSIPLRTALKMLRIALGYGSRTERITRLLNSTDPDVAITARSLMASGYLNPDLGTVDITNLR